MAGLYDIKREIAIIKAARRLRRLAVPRIAPSGFVPHDGDGDNRFSYPGGPDVNPMPIKVASKTAKKAAAKKAPATKKAASKKAAAPAKKASARKAAVKPVKAAAKKAAPKKVASKAAAKAAPKKAVKAVEPPPKKRGDSDVVLPENNFRVPLKYLVPRKKSREAIPGKVPKGDRVDKSNLESLKQNALFSMLFKPLPPDPEPGEPGSFKTFRQRHLARVQQREAARGKFKPGGATTFRRFIPVGHKKGRVEVGNGQYDAGMGMELNEVGAMGEALIMWNPDVRKFVTDRFGQIDHAEGQTLDGRVSNSTFDLFAGEYAIEVKTLNISANKDRYSMGDSKLAAKDDPGQMGYKVTEAKKMGMKPALLIIMVDQESGRVWMLADTKIPTLQQKGHSYSKMEMLTPGKGVYVSQDVLYQAWAFGLLKRPKRVAGTVKYDRAKRRAALQGGRASTEYGGEMESTTLQEMLDAGYTPTGFV